MQREIKIVLCGINGHWPLWGRCLKRDHERQPIHGGGGVYSLVSSEQVKRLQSVNIHDKPVAYRTPKAIPNAMMMAPVTPRDVSSTSLATVAVGFSEETLANVVSEEKFVH